MGGHTCPKFVPDRALFIMFQKHNISSNLIPANYLVGLHVYWKHTLETMSFGNIICIWKHGLDIGNKNWILETYIGYWKRKLDIGNITLVWKHIYIGNI